MISKGILWLMVAVIASSGALPVAAAGAPGGGITSPGCIARDDSFSFMESHPDNNVYTGNIAINDTTYDAVTGSSSTVRGMNGLRLESGARFTLNQHGLFEYIPVDGFVGIDTVSYALVDRTTGITCSQAVVTFAVNVPDYKRVVALDDVMYTTDTAWTYLDPRLNDTYVRTAYYPTANVYALENLTPELGSFVITYDPYDVSKTVVRFDPIQTMKSGVARAQYTLTDSVLGASTAGYITVNIAHENIPPQAYADTFSVVEDTQITGNVLTNDYDPDSSLSAQLSCQPQFGTVSFMPNGSFVYAPQLNYNGTDSFCYTVSDGQYTSRASVILNVTSVNDAPTAQFYATPVAKNQRTFNFDAGASRDVDGSVMRYTWDFGDGSSLTSTSSTVTYSYKKRGTYTVRLTVTDNEGAVGTVLSTVVTR